jgi:hypothetical protein
MAKIALYVHRTGHRNLKTQTGRAANIDSVAFAR